MKNKYSLIAALCCLFILSSLQAQLVTIPSANTQGTGANTSVWRKPFGTSRAYERTAIKYTHAEIGVMGYITSVAFYVDSLNNPGDAITRIFIKEVTDSTFTASTVAAEESGAQLVFDDTIPANAFVKGQWTTVALATPFLHNTTANIEIIIETNSGGTAGTEAAAVGKGFRYSATTGNREQYWQSATGSGTVPAGNGTLTAYRHNVQFNFVAATACVAPPSAGTAVSSLSSACASEPFLVTLSGSSSGTSLSYQWLSSSDGLTWIPIAGDTTSSLSASITANTYFTAIVTCSSQSDTATPVLVSLNPFYNCYCSNLGGSCTAAIDSVAITSTSLANGPTGCATGFYTQYPASGSTTASLVQGQSYQLVTKYSGSAKTSVWIDFNHNGVFDTYEWAQVSLTSSAGVPVISNISVPLSAMTGLTGMRIRSRSSAGTNDSTYACITLASGETEDYLITILPASACVAPPSAGVAAASLDTICAGTPIAISLSGYSSGTGTTFQWITSTDGGSTWNTAAGETTQSMNDSPSMTTYYACIVTCSGQSDTSVAAVVFVKAFYNCYCVTNLGGNCTPAIDSVSFTGTTLANGPTGCSAGSISYPATGNTTATLTQGQTYQLVTTYTGNTKASLWIDYDHNGIFNTYEWTQVTLTSTAGNPVITNVYIPLSAATGLTGMRLRARASNGANDSTNACTNFGSGETEDYLINIAAATPCVAPPSAGIASASQDTVCAGSPTSLSLSGYTSGLGSSIQWISSVDGGATWNVISGAVNPTYNTSVSAVAWYACIVTCSGQSDTSNVVMIAINPFYNCYCKNIGGGCVNQPGTTIDSVSIQGTTLTNGPTGCSAGFYTLYPASGNTTATLVAGQSYTIDVLLMGNARSVMWIDYNQNGVFEASEGTIVCTTSSAGVVNPATFTVPSGATTGLTGLRVRSRSTLGTLDTTSACLSIGTGETEDYVINITPATGVQSAIVSSGFYVFPNPAKGALNIVATGSKNSFVNWSILNTEGKVVMSEREIQTAGNTVKTIDVSHLPKGIYFVRMVADNESCVKKVVIQ